MKGINVQAKKSDIILNLNCCLKMLIDKGFAWMIKKGWREKEKNFQKKFV